MRISDWSSDVCSSDLAGVAFPIETQGAFGIHAGDWCDRGTETQIAAAILVFNFRHEQALVALPVLQRQFHAQQIRLVGGNPIGAGDMAADLLEGAHTVLETGVVDGSV